MAIYAVHRINDKTPLPCRQILIAFTHYFLIVLAYRKLFQNMPATENIVNIESDRKVELESNSKMVTKLAGSKSQFGKQTTFSFIQTCFCMCG